MCEIISLVLLPEDRPAHSAAAAQTSKNTQMN